MESMSKYFLGPGSFNRDNCKAKRKVLGMVLISGNFEVFYLCGCLNSLMDSHRELLNEAIAAILTFHSTKLSRM